MGKTEMYELDLSSYTVKVPATSLDRLGETDEKPFQVRQACVNILMNPQLRMRWDKGHKNYDIALKIEAAPTKGKDKDKVLLSKTEYGRLESAAKQYEGVGYNIMSLLKRIIKETKTVPVGKTEDKEEKS